MAALTTTTTWDQKNHVDKCLCWNLSTQKGSIFQITKYNHKFQNINLNNYECFSPVIAVTFDLY